MRDDAVVLDNQLVFVAADRREVRRCVAPAAGGDRARLAALSGDLS